MLKWILEKRFSESFVKMDDSLYKYWT